MLVKVGWIALDIKDLHGNFKFIGMPFDNEGLTLEAITLGFDYEAGPRWP